MKKNYLTKKQRLEFFLTQKETDTLVGLYLGDLYAKDRSQTAAVRRWWASPPPSDG
jgi:hypothetical protein